jgi:hypothetical protein
VDTIADQRERLPAPDLTQLRHIRQPAGNRRLIELEVTCMDDHPERRRDREADRVGNAVRDPEALDGEAADDDAGIIVRLDEPEIGTVEQLTLLESGLEQALGQARAVDRDPQLIEEIGNRADVILVAMGDEDRTDVVGMLSQVTDIRQEHIDPEHVFFREPDPRIDDDDIVAIFEDDHVLADLAKAAKEHDFQSVCRQRTLDSIRATHHSYQISPPGQTTSSTPAETGKPPRSSRSGWRGMARNPCRNTGHNGPPRLGE